MNKVEVGNPELMDVFEFEVFSNKKGSKQYNVVSDNIINLYGLDNIKVPSNGDVVEAIYIGKNSDQYLFKVDGYKDYIRVDDKSSESKYLSDLQANDSIDILIVSVKQDDFYIRGSVASLYESIARANLKSIGEGSAVMAKIKGLNQAGYDVDIKHGGVTLPAFMPKTLAGVNKLYDPESIIGQTFEVMIESYSQSEGTYIVSRRKYLKTLIPVAISNLESGKVYTGHVTGTTNFGIFVEFDGCLTGMIHKVNVNPEWADKIDMITPGFEIDFYVKEIIKDKIILTQILKDSIWDSIDVGQVLDGVVKENKQFGSLISLDDETLGLIKSSDINRKLIEGNSIKVKVTYVDRLNRKIGLTIAK